MSMDLSNAVLCSHKRRLIPRQVIENEFGEVSIDDALLEEGQVSLKATGTEVRRKKIPGRGSERSYPEERRKSVSQHDFFYRSVITKGQYPHIHVLMSLSSVSACVGGVIAQRLPVLSLAPRPGRCANQGLGGLGGETRRGATRDVRTQ